MATCDWAFELVAVAVFDFCLLLTNGIATVSAKPAQRHPTGDAIFNGGNDRDSNGACAACHKVATPQTSSRTPAS